MKNSIYGKIRKQMIRSIFIAALSVCLIAIISIVIIRGNIIDISEQLGNSAARDSTSALEVQMKESLLLFAQNKASVSDEKLAAVVKSVTVISENATRISSEPENYLRIPPLFPDAANAGITVSQLRLADEDSYNALADEIGLLGNLSGLLMSEFDALDYVASVYIGTESGISISADGDSDKKVNTYDPRTRGWYQIGKETNAQAWSDVFVDNSGRGLGITCVSPYYDKNGNLMGIIGAGMLLDVLNEIVVEAQFGETGYAFIANEHGDMIISDSVTIADDGTLITQNTAEFLPPEAEADMRGGGTDILRVNINEREYFAAYAPLSTLPWSLAFVVSVDEIIKPAKDSEINILNMTNNAIADVDRTIYIIFGVFAGVLVLVLYINTIVARQLAGGLAKPIIELNTGAGIIGAGDLEHQLDVKTGDELEALAGAFNAMIANIKKITAEKERIGAELDVATKIQASMLPSIFPPFPNRNEFDIYASMQPAKEVGGDFYDFFLVDENRLAVVIADVSGKGVPAALFMVIAKTLIKNNAQYGKSPKEVFETVNNLLCEGNEAAMFVTAFMGYLDIPTGTFTYVNAGHNPPLIKRTGGNFEWLPAKPGFILAGMEDMQYIEESVTLACGDMVFLYTDGVTESMNDKQELFSEQRLLDVANKSETDGITEFAAYIKNEVAAFAGDAEQADDITMLILKFGL